MKLYEIHDQVERILADPNCVDQETGEITELALQALEDLDLAREKKAIAVARYILGEEAEASAVWEQAQRLGKRAQAHTNRAKRLRDYLAAHIDVGQVYKDEVVTIAWQRSTYVHLPPDAKTDTWPDEFVRVSREPNRIALKKAIERERADVPENVTLMSRHSLVLR